MRSMTPTLVVCEQSDRWRLAWQTWQSRLVRGESSPAVVRSVRQPDELAAAIERWQPAGVLLEIAVANQVAVCQAIAEFDTSWPRGLSFVVGSSAARSTESAARWAGASGCAWSARELPPLVEWFVRVCQKLDVPAGTWEESIRASLPWVAETALLPAASPTPETMR